MVMMNVKRNVSVIAAAAALSCMVAIAVAPAAQAADDAAGTVTSSRSFPKQQVVRKNLLAESTATSVDNDANWGSTENLDVPHTQSQAEKDAAVAQAAKEQAEKEAAAAAEAAAQAAAAAASRSVERDSLNNNTATSTENGTSDTTDSSSESSSNSSVSAPTNASAEALAAYATQFVGAPYAEGGNTPSGWDCSGFVQYVFAQFGISLPHYSGGQAAVGTAVASLADARPGDIVANAGHAAIYIGNGLVVNALNPADGTQITGLGVFSGSYSIRRVL